MYHYNFSPAASNSLSHGDELHSNSGSTQNPTSFPTIDSMYGVGSENIRHTPKTLGWTFGTEILKLYCFVVPKGQEPYLELLSGWTPTYETPYRVYLDVPARIERNRFPCQYPGPCPGKQSVFGRPADLERHYKNVHADARDTFPCDYSKCPRHQEAFMRKDHYRDHLKDFHKEDISSAKGDKKTTNDNWWKERNISAKSWRCARCLVKNVVAKVGWECSKCHIPCEEERIKAREKLPLEEANKMAMDSTETKIQDGSSLTYPEYASCIVCGGAVWCQNSFGDWEECSACQPGYSFPM